MVGHSQNEDSSMQFKTVTKKSSKKVICGEQVNSTAFRSVMKKAVFCVNRLEPDTSPDVISEFLKSQGLRVKKVKFSHTRYRALGPELIPVYRQSDRR